MSVLVSAALLSAVAAGSVIAGGNEFAQSAETFVGLALQLGRMPGYEAEVDSYFGPQRLYSSPHYNSIGLPLLRAEVHALLSRTELEAAAHPTPRGTRLLGQIRSLDVLLQIIEPAVRHRSFEDEAQRLYASSVPKFQLHTAHQRVAALESVLPGSGHLSQRLVEFYRDFIVPPDLRLAVFDRALQECRSRTLAHWQLPRAEQLDVEWTDGVPAAWHRYRGGWRSTLQVNPNAVALIGSAIDVACHEAYPGHHTQFLLQDERSQPAGLPLEDRVVLLRSPASVLREGAANFGVELAFPFEERVAFDERVLFPLAGLDPGRARQYETVHRLVDQLSVAATPIIAAYYDGRLSSGEAKQQLADEALVTSPSELLQFADHFGAYVLGYTAERDSVRAYVTARSRVTAKDNWSVLREIVSDPYGAPDFRR